MTQPSDEPAHANPYSAPNSVPTSRRQSREYQILSFYQALHHTPPTFLRLFVRSLPRLIALAALSLLGFGIMLAIVVLGKAPLVILVVIISLFLGLFLGIVVSDLGVIRRTLQAWPVLTDIIDWQRVEQRLSGSSFEDESKRVTDRDGLRPS